MTLPGDLEAKVTRRSAAMRAAGPSLPVVDEASARAAWWSAAWEWASRDPDSRRKRVSDGGRWPPTVRVSPLGSLGLPRRAVVAVGDLVRRIVDGEIGRVVALDGRHPIILWRGQARAVSADVGLTGGAIGVAAYRRRSGEEDAAAWRVWSRALVGDARWSRSPRHWVAA